MLLTPKEVHEHVAQELFDVDEYHEIYATYTGAKTKLNAMKVRSSLRETTPRRARACDCLWHEEDVLASNGLGDGRDRHKMILSSAASRNTCSARMRSRRCF